MKNSKSFLKSFFIACGTMTAILLFFVTWMNPYRTLNFPWSTAFVSDRNPVYRVIQRLREAAPFTELIVGSSTSETFVPKVLKKRYGLQFFSTTRGGAPTTSRYMMVKEALRTHPEIRRIIYISDLYEFRPLSRDEVVFAQPELRAIFDSEILELVPTPSFTDRVEDFISHRVIEQSARTFLDWVENLKGNYQSKYRADGSVSSSLYVKNYRDPIIKRAKHTTIDYESRYRTMERLDPSALLVFQKMLALVENLPQVELVVVLPPWHPAFYEHFQSHLEKTQLYTQWTETIKELAQKSKGHIRVEDFSFSRFQERGIGVDKRYWHDGVHFSSESMLLITDSIYKKH